MSTMFTKEKRRSLLFVLHAVMLWGDTENGRSQKPFNNLKLVLHLFFGCWKVRYIDRITENVCFRFYCQRHFSSNLFLFPPLIADTERNKY